MVQIQKSKQRFTFSHRFVKYIIPAFLLYILYTISNMVMENSHEIKESTFFHTEMKPGDKRNDFNSGQISKNITSSSCEYTSLNDLKDYERFPQVSATPDGNNRRHAYPTPKDGLVTLVCCESTKGFFSVAVHHNWAPLGSRRFLDMVERKYFSSKVALMRCVKNFICQFGIAGDPTLNKDYKSIPDDLNWLPEGKEYRENQFGASRFLRGYFAYAGSGKNSRSNQLIVALKDNGPLGGGSPWEVPFAELVGSYSYDTLSKISTKYGEQGPSQGLLRKEGSSLNVKELFPDLDYITSCTIVDTADMSSKVE